MSEILPVSFNSTRCIRNPLHNNGGHYHYWLSTPHGALGTFSYAGVSEMITVVYLSTPHGALGTSTVCRGVGKLTLLSTPHGALGTYNSVSK